MKKIISLLVLLLCMTGYTVAQTYGSSYNQVLKLIGAMDETDGPIAHADWPWINSGEPYVPTVDDSFEGTDYNGFKVVSEFGFIGIYKSETFRGIWGGASGNYNYVGAGSIDWSDKGWVQKAETPIVLEPTLTGSVIKDQQRDDLTFLKTLKLSGNNFNSIQIVGHDRMTALETVDLSNDVGGLDLFEIHGCPNLKTLNVSATGVSVANNGFLFSTLNGFNVTATTYTYAPQGTVNLTFPVNAVDLSAEYAVGTDFTNWSTTPASSDNGLFSFPVSMKGQTVTVTLTNNSFPDITGLTVSITLDGGVYKITTAEELDAVRNDLSGTYTLMNDLDLTEYIETNYPTDGWLPIGDGASTAFRGTFDGNGHVISGLWINRPGAVYVGLFGGIGYYRVLKPDDTAGATEGPNTTSATSTFGATIKDLAIIADTISGDYNVGALAGVIGNSIITGIYVNAIVVGKNESGHGYNIGGLAGCFWGRNNTTLLQDCYTTGNVTGRRGAGGVLGSTFQNEVTISIKRVYSTAKVTMAEGSGYYKSEVGGIIGAYQSPDGLVKVNSSFAINDTIVGYEAKSDGRTGRFIGGFKTNLSSSSRIFTTDIYGLKTTKIRLYNVTGSDYQNLYYEIDPNDTITTLTGSTASLIMYKQRQAINKTAQELIQQSTYSELSTEAWDFSETWTMGNDYYPLPVLKKLPASAQPDEYPAHLKFDITVATTAGENGSISTHTNVKAGDDVSVEVTPSTGYKVDEFTVNGVDKHLELVDNQYVISCIKDNYTVHVTFVVDQKTGMLASQTIDSDLPVATRYYTLQGIEIARPLETGLYIARHQYQSGKEIITKVFIHKEK